MPNISLYFVRHGQRIDHVDASWIDTSPCPQDPPLTDLGKQQARHTGKMIRNLAREDASLHDSHHRGTEATLQSITPPVSPANRRDHLATAAAASLVKRPHHFAIVTSPFLRCTQTAVEMAIGMRMARANSKETAAALPTSAGWPQVQSISSHAADAYDEREPDKDLVTISVESGIAEWLSLEYVSEPVPDSIIVQRMQDFAKARRDHEQYYSIDWKYIAKERQLPPWPETREDMQTRLERALEHTLQSYIAAAAKDKNRDLSIVFVTHASPVNALLEACLQTPILIPIPNCSISRCLWTPQSMFDDSLLDAPRGKIPTHSAQAQTIDGEEGRWLLDYQAYTAHLGQ